MFTFPPAKPLPIPVLPLPLPVPVPSLVLDFKDASPWLEKLLGRASSIGAFVKRDEESGCIKISLRVDTAEEKIVIMIKIDTHRQLVEKSRDLKRIELIYFE